MENVDSYVLGASDEVKKQVLKNVRELFHYAHNKLIFLTGQTTGKTNGSINDFQLYNKKRELYKGAVTKSQYKNILERDLKDNCYM